MKSQDFKRAVGSLSSNGGNAVKLSWSFANQMYDAIVDKSGGGG